MTMNMLRRAILLLLPLLASALPSRAADVVWYDGTHPVSYCVEGRASAVVSVALDMFASDMGLVTGHRAVQSRRPDATIVVCQADRCSTSQLRELRRWGVPVDSLLRAFDAFCLKATADGHVVVAGSNARGTAYGVLELSRMAGVSPWVWWGDVRPHTASRLTMTEGYHTLQAPSVRYRGIFINDEDWSLREWSAKTFEPTGIKGSIGPRTYKEIFKLLLRLRANTIWPAMHEGTTGFFTMKANKLVADSCGILIGTSHCEPLLRNNVAEWDVRTMGPYNYISNGDRVRRYWAERLKEVRGSEELFTIGMRGIHDGSMEGVKTKEEKLSALQQVIDDQRELIGRYYSKEVERVPQVFIPYKEVLEIMESGLRVPDDVTLMWCDDNYGYLTRLPDAEQQRRSGGGGVYYHLSYWGRPHDHLWLTTTQPGLIYQEMRTAYDHNCRRLWIANVHDPKVAAYDLELFLDMAWHIDAITPATLEAHLEQWLSTQFGHLVGHAIFPVMKEFYRLNAVRKPEFMGWTQVELDKKKYPGGKSVPDTTQLTLTEAYRRMADFARIEAVADVYAPLVPDYRQDAYFAHVLYPVHASAAMTRKMLSPPTESRQAYEEIVRLTERYNAMGHGKWNHIMSAAPRALPVFAQGARTQLPQHPTPAYCISRNACDYQAATGRAVLPSTPMLGHSMQAVPLPKGCSLEYRFSWDCDKTDATLYTAMIPTQPSDRGDLRYSVLIDDQTPVVVSLKEPYRSEQWKQNVLRQQALKKTPVRLSRGWHRLTISALDDHIIADQWMIDARPDRLFYVIPTDSK